VNSGFAANLRWSVSNATDVQIDKGIGQVAPTGRRDVSPTDTSEYTLRASNATGTVMASVVVTITKPPTRVDSSEAPMSRAEALATKLQDLHFDYNSDNISVADQPILERDAAVLKDLFEVDPGVSITIEGHCDERGSAEYNLALGDRRANAVRQALSKFGCRGEKLNVASFGKEHLLCADKPKPVTRATAGLISLSQSKHLSQSQQQLPKPTLCWPRRSTKRAGLCANPNPQMASYFSNLEITPVGFVR
jgi:peptidoglycan-associated lipoprotein